MKLSEGKGKTCVCANCSLHCSLSQVIGNLSFIKNLRVKRGEVIFEQGSPAFGIYYLCSGQVKLTSWTCNGDPQSLVWLSSGALLGAEILVRELRHNYCAQAVEDSRLLFIAREELPNLQGAAATELLKMLAKQMLQWQQRLKDSLGLKVTERIMRVLWQLHQQNHCRITNAELAALVGSNSGTVCQILHRLKEEGLIQHSRSELQIISPQEFLESL